MGMLRTLRRGLTWAALGLAGGAVVVTVRHLLESPQPLHSALNGTARIDRAHGGEMYYNVAGPEGAAPIVVLHDFSPGASNYEYRDVFGILTSANRVYAPDWLGYGMSEHPNIAYTGEFYANVLAGFLRDVVAAPATVVGLGRAANVVVRAASDAPRLFGRVVLVSPDIAAGAQAEPTLAQTLVRATQRAFLGIVPYAIVSTRPALRFLSARTSARHEASGATTGDEALDQRYASAHQFGGQYAALAMLTGELDLPVRNAFALLEPPALVVIGDEDRQRPAQAVAEWTGVNPRADLELIPDAGYDVPGDQPRAFVTALDRWLETLPPAPIGSQLPESEERDMPGMPGYVVPGVSDMGMEGPATVTIDGVTTMEPELELGPEPSPTEAELEAELTEQGLAGTPADLLPEAGDADPASVYEEMARQGTNPPLEPAGNIASVAAAAEELEATRQAGAGERDDELAGPGQLEGLVHDVETPEPDQERGSRRREARNTRPLRDTRPLADEPRASSSAANGDSDPLSIEERPTAPQRRIQPNGPQSSTRAAPRAPRAHMQARAGAGSTPSDGATKAGVPRTKARARRAKGSKETTDNASGDTGTGTRGPAH